MLITSFIVLDWTCWIIVSSLMSHVHNLKCEPICPLKCPTRAHRFVEHHSVSVPGRFAWLISPNNQPNHQFPHFHAGYNHCWYWTLTLTVIQYVHLQGKKKHMNPNLTVVIHVAWPHVRYVPDLGPLTKVAQVWLEKIRHLHPHSSGKKNKKSDQCNVQSENQMCVTSTWSCKVDKDEMKMKILLHSTSTLFWLHEIQFPSLQENVAVTLLDWIQEMPCSFLYTVIFKHLWLSTGAHGNSCK